MKWLRFGDFVDATGTKEAHVYVDRLATVGDAIVRFPGVLFAVSWAVILAMVTIQKFG